MIISLPWLGGGLSLRSGEGSKRGPGSRIGRCGRKRNAVLLPFVR